MIPISSEVGLWIVDAYSRMRSHLQLGGVIDGESLDCSAVVESTSAIGENISLKLFDRTQGQNGECIRPISLAGAAFRFDPRGGATPDGSRFNSALEVTVRTGAVLLFVERLTDAEGL